ncbi:CD276 antigen homolog isoform X2 [Rhinichthys klamathensis goyatoka]|uniref:CD276 antigen homolog isoform X2 n=1 Tax=Rhinichthys klamathensis goyatoka TaxID=3034132 RepID=UPI0024B5B89C|nr:CD276 antigen homolog isoform X2 [Rhinichthys klamathensis goyatoka]
MGKRFEVVYQREKRYWFMYLFLHLIDKVSLQDPVPVSGVVGGSVILPCSYKERKLKTEEINVFWRYKQKTIVYDIENGSPLTENQDAMFKGRIEGFPSEHADGNFSLRLSDLRLTDEGQFSCFILNVKKEHKLTLLVRAMPTTVSTPKSTVNARSSSMRAQPEGVATFLLLIWRFVFCTISE